MANHTRDPTDAWRTAGITTLVVERNEAGEYRVTQHGVDAVGTGPTAPRAAADYCLALEDRDD